MTTKNYLAQLKLNFTFTFKDAYNSARFRLLPIFCLKLLTVTQKINTKKIDLSKLVFLPSQVFHAAPVMLTNYDIAK